MDISALKPDEIEVECEVRGIASTSSDAITKLIEHAAAENAGTTPVPTRMHSKAGKRPDLEINFCKTKLLRLQQDIANLTELQLDGARLAAAHNIRSRLLHVRGRLERVSQSNTYREQAGQALQSCNDLLISVNLYLENEDNLNDSVNAARRVEIEEDRENPSEKPVSLNFNENFIVLPPPQPGTSTRRESLGSLSDQDNGANQKNAIGGIDSRSDANASDKNFFMLSMMARLDQLSAQLTTINKRQNDFQAQLGKQSVQITENLSGRPLPTNPIVLPGNHPLPPRVQFQDQGNTVVTPPMYNNFNNRPYGDQPYGPARNSSVNLLPPSVPQPADIGIEAPSHLRYIAPSGHNPTGLRRSGISYNGDPAGITVDMFFFQLETVATSMNLTPEALMAEMYVVLKDMALQWYWTYRRHNPMASWLDLKRDFIERFKDRRTDYEIRRAVESRKQQPNESFLDFYHKVWNLTLQCRTPYSDEEFIQLMLTNMKPMLQYQLTDRQFSNINDLIKSCVAWEETFKRFRGQPDYSLNHRRVINELQAVNQNEAADANQNLSSQIPETHHNYSINALQSGARNSTTLKPCVESTPVKSNLHTSTGLGHNPICYNCRDIGHTFMDCPIPPKGIFCYRCGLEDTISSRCSRCSENSTRGQWRSGIHSAPTNIQPSSAQVTARSQNTLTRTTPQ